MSLKIERYQKNKILNFSASQKSDENVATLAFKYAIIYSFLYWCRVSLRNKMLSVPSLVDVPYLKVKEIYSLSDYNF